MLRLVHVPANTLLAFKVAPGDGQAVDTAALGRQGPEDWSALYAQFSVEHAVRYLPNHWDRGHSAAALVTLTTCRALCAYVLTDAAMQRVEVSSAEKAAGLRAALREAGVALADGVPLLRALGEAAPDAFVVLYDSEELECALPHSLVESQAFSFQPLCTFAREERAPWATAAVGGLQPPLALSKEEQQDATRLAGAVAERLSPNTTPALQLLMGSSK